MDQIKNMHVKNKSIVLFLCSFECTHLWKLMSLHDSLIAICLAHLCLTRSNPSIHFMWHRAPVKALTAEQSHWEIWVWGKRRGRKKKKKEEESRICLKDPSFTEYFQNSSQKQNDNVLSEVFCKLKSIFYYRLVSTVSLAVHSFCRPYALVVA